MLSINQIRTKLPRVGTPCTVRSKKMGQMCSGKVSHVNYKSFWYCVEFRTEEDRIWHECYKLPYTYSFLEEELAREWLKYGYRMIHHTKDDEEWKVDTRVKILKTSIVYPDVECCAKDLDKTVEQIYDAIEQGLHLNGFRLAWVKA